MLGSVYFTMTDKYSLLSCISYRADHPLSTCNSHPVLQRIAAEQFSFVVRSSKRKIFLRGNKRENIRFSKDVCQLTCRTLSLSHSEITPEMLTVALAAACTYSSAMPGIPALLKSVKVLPLISMVARSHAMLQRAFLSFLM